MAAFPSHRLVPASDRVDPPDAHDDGRHPWRLVVVGYAACILTGLGFAWTVQHAPDWNAGLPWERTLLLRIHDVRTSPAMERLLLAVPWAGTNLTLFPLSVFASLFLAARRGRRDLATWLMTVALGCLSLNWLLKELTQRARPDLWERVGWYGMAAYPSGHAMVSIAVLGTVAVILRRERRWRWPAWAVAATVAAIAYSRMYHGVHWPTDLIGGAAVGLVWLFVTARVFTGVARRAAATAAAPA